MGLSTIVYVFWNNRLEEFAHKYWESAESQTSSYTFCLYRNLTQRIADLEAYMTHLEKETATHSSIHAWKIPWTEEPGGLQSMGSQRVRHDWVTLCVCVCVCVCVYDPSTKFISLVCSQIKNTSGKLLVFLVNYYSCMTSFCVIFRESVNLLQPTFSIK